MKKKYPIFIGIAFVIAAIVCLVSCENDKSDNINISEIDSENTLRVAANAHNMALDYLKSDVENNAVGYTSSRLDSAIGAYMIKQYSHTEADIALKKTKRIKNLVSKGCITSATSRSGAVEEFTDHVNIPAQQSLNESVQEIADYLKLFPEDELFDNKNVTIEIQHIILKTYARSIEHYSSEIDQQAISQTLGVLYGSVEYWMDSENVKFWSNVSMDENSSVFSRSENQKKEDTVKKEEPKVVKDDRKLSASDYIITLAAADAIGGLAGCGAASAPAAAAVSALAGIYFDVE